MASSRETVLYYEPGDTHRAAQVKSVLVRMGVRIKNVSAAQTGETVGHLLGRKDFAARQTPETEPLPAPVLVLDGFTDKRLELLLRALKAADVAVPYKAVVTESNLVWLFSQLYAELEAEHAAMQPQ